MNNIMLDLETMGTKPDAAIIAIGAVRFGGGEIVDEFYTVVDLASSVDAGLKMDTSTVLWWMKQSDDARGQFERKGVSLESALRQFSTWAGHDPEMWGNGAAFDNVILATAYDKCGVDRPWAFWNDRCYRTAKTLHPEVKMERQGVYHCALDDARSQAIHLMKILNEHKNDHTLQTTR